MPGKDQASLIVDVHDLFVSAAVLYNQTKDKANQDSISSAQLTCPTPKKWCQKAILNNFYHTAHFPGFGSFTKIDFNFFFMTTFNVYLILYQISLAVDRAPRGMKIRKPNENILIPA